MKKVLHLLILVNIICFIGCAQSTGGKSNTETEICSVVFESNGGTPVESVELIKNSTLGVYPYNIWSEGKVFVGWYSDEALTQRVQSTTIITKNTKLYARWDTPYEGTPNLVYEESSDGLTAFLSRSSLDIAGAVKIANVYNEKPVTRISAQALSAEYYDGRKKVTSIDIPDTVTSIGLRAFHTSIRANPINLPDGLGVISESLFVWCIGDIIIPNGVKVIEKNAFIHTENMNTISIPESVIDIHERAFVNTGANISIHKDNPKYKIVDGVIYTKDGKTLLHFSPKKTGNFTIPDTVTTIGSSAFEYTSLATVTIPRSVTTINGAAFYNAEFALTINVQGYKNRPSGWIEDWNHTIREKNTVNWAQ